MGTDITMYAESFNNDTNEWEKIGKIFIDSGSVLVDRIYSYINNNFISKSDKVKPFEFFERFYLNTPNDKYEIKCFNCLTEEFGDSYKTDLVYSECSYRMFGVLNKTRFVQLDPIGEVNRGLPKDVSTEIKNLLHTDKDIYGNIEGVNYLYLSEIINSIYYYFNDDSLVRLGLSYYFFRTVPKMLLINGYDPYKTRFVFWFDR